MKDKKEQGELRLVQKENQKKFLKDSDIKTKKIKKNNCNTECQKTLKSQFTIIILLTPKNVHIF